MRVLLVYLNQGAGPHNAMLSLRKAFDAFAPQVQLEVGELCEMDKTGIFRRLLQHQHDWRYRVAHDLPMSLPYRVQHKAMIAAAMRMDAIHRRATAKLVRSTRPDVIASILSTPAQIIADVLRDGVMDVPFAHVCTDFVVERRDAVQRANLVTVANRSSVSVLHGFGLPADVPLVTGIPIDPTYEVPADPASIRKALEVDTKTERPLILQIHSGHGDPIEKRLAHMRKLRTPSDIVVAGVPGRAPGSIEVLEQTPEGHRIRIMGHTDRVRELLAAADLVVTKAGALTAAQALASKCVLVFMNTLPGIEQGNIEQLLEAGAATRVYEESALPFELERLLTDTDRLNRMQRAAATVAQPAAARTVVAAVVQLVEQRLRAKGAPHSGDPMLHAR